MFKKYFFIGCCLFFSFFHAQAQTLRSNAGASSYENSVGLTLDFGTNGLGAGPGIKHFFTEHDAGEVNLLFYEDAFSIVPLYEYHGDIENADGLKWYLGLGPQVSFYTGKGSAPTLIAARILGGLDYKVPNIPINLAFDWRPMLRLNEGTKFIPARFAFALRFAF